MRIQVKLETNRYAHTLHRISTFIFLYTMLFVNIDDVSDFPSKYLLLLI